MFVVRWILIALLLLQATAVWASTDATDRTLRVYGPGGPHKVLSECAKIFNQRHGLKVAVIKAMPHELERRLHQDGDLYYGGAEYMLVDLVDRYPDLFDMQSVELLQPRRVGIIVRKGNPLQIEELADLEPAGIDILDVKLENMQGFQNAPFSLAHNLRQFVYTGQHGVNAWLSNPDIDAWITYRSWHFQLRSDSEFIELPGVKGLRHTPMAITNHSRNRQTAEKFIEFLKSAEARALFEQHGWN